MSSVPLQEVSRYINSAKTISVKLAALRFAPKFITIGLYMKKYNKGATWRIWDLQIQTIIDDGYQSLDSYYVELKSSDPEKWNRFTDKVGGEEKALLYDSKSYFSDSSV